MGFQESGAGEDTVKSSQYLVAIAQYACIKAQLFIKANFFNADAKLP
ncbi:MAG: hypothetical protein RM022_003355 [Nostoc sp. EfeVER01]|nr:hypothetical protein [Nostoc sp. EfeVER01]MDZ7946918.1 hypothetical protein [Nostoc sp. EfeVER01]